MTTLFDTYLMIDWSAAAEPKSGTDSIWCALLDRSEEFTALKNPKTRRIARDCLGSILDALLEGTGASWLDSTSPSGTRPALPERLAWRGRRGLKPGARLSVRCPTDRTTATTASMRPIA